MFDKDDWLPISPTNLTSWWIIFLFYPSFKVKLNKIRL